MKKVAIITFLLSMLTIGWTPHAAHADSLPDDYRGYVRDNGVPIADASVHIRCRNKSGVSTMVETNRTDINGFFRGTYAPDTCEKGSVLHFFTKVGDKYSELYVTITRDLTTVELNLVPFVQVPEYNWLGGIIAVSGGLSAVVAGAAPDIPTRRVMRIITHE